MSISVRVYNTFFIFCEKQFICFFLHANNNNKQYKHLNIKYK